MFFLRSITGGLLATALAAPPLAHRSTPPARQWLLVALLGGAALCWTLACLQARRLPPLPAPVWLGLALLGLSLWPWLAGGWTPTPAAGFTENHFARVAAGWPHSVISAGPGVAVALPAGLGLALVMAADLARERQWLLLFATVITLSAVAVVLLALMQNLSHAAGIFWRHEGRLPGHFWGTFFHHTSAGAYLNTAWPMAAGLACLYAGRRSRTLLALGAGAAAGLLFAAQASHVARLPLILGLLTLGLFIRRFHLWHRVSRRTWIIALGGAGLVMLVFGRAGEIAARWGQMSFRPAAHVRPVPPERQWPRLVRDDLLIPNVYNAGRLGDRGEAQAAALRAIAARPWTGHGPGNWTGAASHHTSDPYVRSFYLYLQFAHEDFLQAGVERGGAGALGFLLLLPLAVFAAFRAVRRPDSAGPRALGWCAAAGLGAVLLQSLLDFPLQIPAVALNAHVLAGLAWMTAADPSPLA